MNLAWTLTEPHRALLDQVSAKAEFLLVESAARDVFRAEILPNRLPHLAKRLQAELAEWRPIVPGRRRTPGTSEADT